MEQELVNFQNFVVEAMPGQVCPPYGELLLAHESNPEPVGCGAMRPILPEGCCELKRLYVAPAERRCGIGEALVKAMINTATRRTPSIRDVSPPSHLHRTRCRRA